MQYISANYFEMSFKRNYEEEYENIQFILTFYLNNGALQHAFSSINTNLNMNATFSLWEVSNVTINMSEEQKANQMKTRDMESGETLKEKNTTLKTFKK